MEEFGLPGTPGCQKTGSNSSFDDVAGYPGIFIKKARILLFFPIRNCWQEIEVTLSKAQMFCSLNQGAP